MAIWKEFKEFAMRGSVIDLAVGVIIGAAFGKITSSLVNDVIMPPIGVLLGGADMSKLQIVLRDEVRDAAGNVLTPGAVIKYGLFINTIIDFLLVAAAVFAIVKLVNVARRKGPEAPPAPSKSEALLADIRDLLKTHEIHEAHG